MLKKTTAHLTLKFNLEKVLPTTMRMTDILCLIS